MYSTPSSKRFGALLISAAAALGAPGCVGPSPLAGTWRNDSSSNGDTNTDTLVFGATNSLTWTSVVGISATNANQASAGCLTTWTRVGTYAVAGMTLNTTLTSAMRVTTGCGDATQNGTQQLTAANENMQLNGSTFTLSGNTLTLVAPVPGSGGTAYTKQ